VVTVTSPYGYRVQYINLIHYNMKAKAVKNMINGNTALLHIRGNQARQYNLFCRLQGRHRVNWEIMSTTNNLNIIARLPPHMLLRFLAVICVLRVIMIIEFGEIKSKK